MIYIVKNFNAVGLDKKNKRSIGLTRFNYIG
mgnify:CR=1 FL=1